MCSVRSCCAVSGMDIVLSGPLVKIPELLCQSFYFGYFMCVSGGGSASLWWVGGVGVFLKVFRGFHGASLCGTLRLISINGSGGGGGGSGELCFGALCLVAP